MLLGSSLGGHKGVRAGPDAAKDPPKKSPKAFPCPGQHPPWRTPCSALGGAASPQHLPVRLQAPCLVLPGLLHQRLGERGTAGGLRASERKRRHEPKAELVLLAQAHSCWGRNEQSHGAAETRPPRWLVIAGGSWRHSHLGQGTGHCWGLGGAAPSRRLQGRRGPCSTLCPKALRALGCWRGRSPAEHRHGPEHGLALMALQNPASGETEAA